MTGYGGESEQLKALSAGFDMHMTKPIGAEVVDRVLEALLQRNASACALPVVVAAPASHSRVSKVEGRRDVKTDSVNSAPALVAANGVDDE